MHSEGDNWHGAPAEKKKGRIWNGVERSTKTWMAHEV